MDNEFLGERRRALEEAYFAKHNRALLERMRAARERADKDAGSGEGADLHRDGASRAYDGAAKASAPPTTAAPLRCR